MSSAESTRPVAVVTGASRGLGRGIAIALGEAGFTVYCTGRSDRQRRPLFGTPLYQPISHTENADQ